VPLSNGKVTGGGNIFLALPDISISSYLKSSSVAPAFRPGKVKIFVSRL
jgi:hypothetical protein